MLTEARLDPHEITRLLNIVKEGDRSVLDLVFNQVYQQLKTSARQQRYRYQRQADMTLNTAALINEAYLKITEQQQYRWENQSHFLATAAVAMRHILIDYSRQKIAAKRGGDQPVESLSDFDDSQMPCIEVDLEQAESLVALDNALQRLAKTAERESRVVECRFYGGMTIEETSKLLNISTGTVKRDWTLAQAWLFKEMQTPSA